MNILVFNCGSSSLKYKLVKIPGETILSGGEAQRVGPATAVPSCLFHRGDEGEERIEVPMPDHAAAFREVWKCLHRDSSPAIDALGHRVVHGGEYFTSPTLITPEVLATLHKTANLAPIHNPPAVGLIATCSDQVPNLPQVAVFDTAYHSTIPAAARTYALPASLRNDHGIRKYGFHGTSHQFVVEETARFLKCPLDRFNAVSCHLGSGGASLCAVRNGTSVDNTMGYSPLQGLMMSTRCGDLDPSLPLRYLQHAGTDSRSLKAVEQRLNKQSGVLGASGYSADIRDVLRTLRSDDGLNDAPTDRARLNLTAQLYVWRLRKYLGAYLALAGTPQAVILTDTIGETVPEARAAICDGLEFFGVNLDATKNRTSELPADIATDDSPVRIVAVLTNEELAIARQTAAVFDRATAMTHPFDGDSSK